MELMSRESKKQVSGSIFAVKCKFFVNMIKKVLFETSLALYPGCSAMSAFWSVVNFRKEHMRTVNGADKATAFSDGAVTEQGISEKLIDTGAIYWLPAESPLSKTKLYFKHIIYYTLRELQYIMRWRG